MSQSTLVIALNQIISDHGIDVLKDGKRLIAMFSDYRPDGRGDKNKLRIAYEFDIAGIIFEALNNSTEVSLAYSKAINLLKEEAFVDENVATSIVYDIAEVIKQQYDRNAQTPIPQQQEEAVHEDHKHRKKPDKHYFLMRKKTRMQRKLQRKQACLVK